MINNSSFSDANDIDSHLLRMNFIEFLTSYLEGRVSLAMVLHINERVYTRDPQTLPQPLVEATQTLHGLKKRVDEGEAIVEDTFVNTINDIVLNLITINKQRNEFS